MAKKKNKMVSKKAQKVNKINPFEVKIFKEKFKITGKKSKNMIGLPGVSRSRDIEKRNKTLFHEYQRRFKSNQFKDKRIGEKDPTIPVFERMTQRFAAEKKRTTEEITHLSLVEEELTHKGQSLKEIEQFEDPNHSESDEDDRGKLEGKMVSDMQFGGFFTNPGDKDDKRSWKDKMEEMIKLSRKERYDRQKLKEENTEMTKKLDEEFNVFRNNDRKSGFGEGPKQSQVTATRDKYDMLLNTLKLESKAAPSDRKKKPEEIAREEKDKLEKLEAERMLRMNGLLKEYFTKVPQHVSADALEDDWQTVQAEKRRRVGFQHPEIDSCKDSADNKLESREGNEADSKEESDSNVESDDEEDTGEEDCGSNLDMSSGSEAEESDGENATLTGQNETLVQKFSGTREKRSILKKVVLSEEEIQNRKAVMDKAKNEVPYTFNVPKTYTEFQELMNGFAVADRLTVVNRLIACHHTSLSEKNKQKLEKLLPFLIEYFGEIPLNTVEGRKFITDLQVPIHALVIQFPNTAAKAVNKYLINVHQRYTEKRDQHDGRGRYLQLSEIQYFSLVSTLFPASDFRHEVCTRALTFLAQLLHECPVRSEKDILTGIILTALCLEYITIAKRYIAEPVTFLHGLLFYAVEKEVNKYETVFSPFTPISKFKDLLLLKDKRSAKYIVPCQLEASLLFDSPQTLQTDQFRVSALYTCLGLLLEFSQLWEELPAHREVFHCIKDMAAKLPISAYHTAVQEKATALLEHIEEVAERPREFLVYRNDKPATIKLLEPRFEEKYSGQKNPKLDSHSRQLKVLKAKVKRENRAAIREIRKDNVYLANVRLQETKQADAERKRKVKEILGQLANQEGDFKQIKRMKK